MGDLDQLGQFRQAIDEIDGMMVVCPGAFYGAHYMSYAEIDIFERIGEQKNGDIPAPGEGCPHFSHFSVSRIVPRIIKVVMEDAQIR